MQLPSDGRDGKNVSSEKEQLNLIIICDLCVFVALKRLKMIYQLN